jgi:NitT/TauT family transport system permease protein
MKVAAAAGIGSRLLFGSYYSQTVQLFSALVAASVMAALLVTLVGVAEKIVLRRMGGEP